MPIEAVRAAIAKFDDERAKHLSLGVYDPEPESVWHTCLSRAARGLDPAIPSTGDGWELFDFEDGSDDRAAQSLRMAAKAACDEIASCTLAEQSKLITYLRDYAWRAYWP